MKKRILLCSALMCIVATMFCGCSGSSNSDSSTSVPESIRGSYYRNANDKNSHYIKIYSSGRVTCNNVITGVYSYGQTGFLTGTGTGTAEVYDFSSNESFYHLTLYTSDYKIRNYKGDVILMGVEESGEDPFTASLNKECNTITKNTKKYRK